MKLKLRFALSIINLGLIITLGGCTTAVDLGDSVIISSPSLILTSEISTPDPITPTAASTIVVQSIPTLAATSKITPTMAITPTLTTNPLVDTPTAQPKTCITPAQRFNITGVLDIHSYTHLAFQGENTILFEGWGPRPEPQYPPSNPAQLTPGPSPYIPSARVLLQAGQIDLEAGLILTRTLNVDPLLNDLEAILAPSLDGQWSQERLNKHVDVLSQSPNRQWQLVQISDLASDINGIWLMSQTEEVQLVSYVPWSSSWEWADDSSILWYHHTVYEFGYDALLIYLQHPPLANGTDLSTENPLDATYYRLAFSPTDKTILSTNEPIDPSWGIEDPDKLFIIDAYDMQSYIVQTIPGLTMAVWNQATESFILMVWREEGTDFMSLDGTVLVHVPTELAPFTFALSPSGQRLAIGYGSAGIWVYECGD